MAYSAVFPAPRRRFTTVPVVLLLVAFLVGGLLAMNLALKGPSVSLAPSQRLPGIADEVRTSFGFIAVENAVATIGPFIDVAAGSIEVQLGVALRNNAALPLLFSASQFELLDGRGHVVPPVNAASALDLLEPNGTTDMSLRFVTNSAARPFMVRFVDDTTHRTFEVSLGEIGCLSPASCPGVVR